MLRSKNQFSIFFIVLFVSFILANNMYAQEVIWQFSTNMGNAAEVERLTIINDVSGNGIQEVIAGTRDLPFTIFCIEGETGSLIWDFPMNTKVGDLKTIEDLNGNGSQEVLVAEGFWFVIPPIPPVGPKLYCLDGETGVEIWSFTPDPQGFIPVLDIISDVTGDGVSDIIAGSDSCWVALVDGSNGNPVWSSSVPGQHIQAVSPIGDVNNDGLCDVLIGNWDDPGIVTGSYCFSGVDGTIIWERTINDIQSNCVKSIPDIDDDGIEDVIIGTMEGIMYAFSGTSFPPPIWQTSIGGGLLIQEVVITQDITGDGKNEVIAGSWDDNVYCFDGASGSILWTYQVANWVHTVAITNDVSGDGVKDVLVGDRGNATGGGAYAGSVYCLDGIDGTLLWSYETEHMVWAVSPIENVNGSGASDVIAGSDDGYVYCLEGNQNFIPLNPPQNLFVTELGYATWDEPSSSDLIGYNVYLDDTYVEFTTNLFYQYNGLVNGTTYMAKVTAIYNEGESDPIEYTFVYNPTLNPPQNLDVACIEDHAHFTWEAPIADIRDSKKNTKIRKENTRDLTGYNIYLDQVEVATNISDLEYDFYDLINGNFYDAGVKAVYDEGTSELIEINFEYTETGAENILPLFTELTGNYPNPFNPITIINYSLAEEGNIELIVFNIKGQQVKTLINERLPAGNHQIIWDGKDENSKTVSSGIYFYKMNTNNYTSTKRMILMK